MACEIKYIDNAPEGDLPRFAFINSVYFPIPLDDDGSLSEEGSDNLILAQEEDFSAVGVIHLDATLTIEGKVVAESGESLVVLLADRFRLRLIDSYESYKFAIHRFVGTHDEAIEYALCLANTQAGINDQPDDGFDSNNEANLSLKEDALMALQLMRVDSSCSRVSVEYLIKIFANAMVDEDEDYL